ncbi:MAG TPA: hypothetical protein ENN24_07890 [Bacteroidetes bacterium]|nr:hypothetical protein [Bacteroidota bacterium]
MYYLIICREAGELFFSSLAKNDWQLVNQIYPFFEGNSENAKMLKSKFGGLTIMQLGEPFKSGQYVGEFVPYEIRLQSGKTIRHNLALRNDNPNKVWMVDGGF